MTRLVYLASPYSGDVAANTTYARDALRHSLSMGEAPFAPHLLYTQVLDDSAPGEREAGMRAGAAVLACCDLLAVYTELGISHGMRAEIEEAERLGIPIVYRELPDCERVVRWYDDAEGRAVADGCLLPRGHRGECRG